MMRAKKPADVFGPGAYLELYLDDAAVGCGWRRYLVVRLGPKWVRLVCTENAEPVTVARKNFLPRPLELKPTRLLRRLRAIAADYGKSDDQTVKLALGILRARKGSK
jgi:hypothetical protein